MEHTAECKITSRINLAKVLRFVEKADQFNSYIVIETNKTTINAKSLLGMCMFAASPINGTITLRTSGTDAKNALEDLKNLLSNG